MGPFGPGPTGTEVWTGKPEMGPGPWDLKLGTGPVGTLPVPGVEKLAGNIKNNLRQNQL